MLTEDLLPILLLSYGAFIALTLIVSEALTTRWFKQKLRKAIDQKTDRRARIKETFVSSVRQAWGAVGLSGLILVVLSILLAADAEAMVLMLAFSTIATIVTAGLLLTGSMDQVKRKGVIKEFRRIMREGDRAQFNDLVHGTLSFGKLRFNILAVQAMERWGAPDVKPVLKDLFEQTPPGYTFRPPGLKEIARQASGRIHIEEDLLRRNQKSVWLQQAKVYLFPRRVLKAASNIHSAHFNRLMEGFSPKTYPVPFQQYELHMSFDELVCRDCRTRAVKVPNDYGTFVQCRICGKSETLETGAKRLVGRIGAGKDWEREGESLYVQLWNDERKEPQFADVDALAFGQLKGANADWAIAAVLETLRNHLPPTKLPIPLESEPPKQLSNNALHQLRIISNI